MTTTNYGSEIDINGRNCSSEIYYEPNVPFYTQLYTTHPQQTESNYYFCKFR